MGDGVNDGAVSNAFDQGVHDWQADVLTKEYWLGPVANTIEGTLTGQINMSTPDFLYSGTLDYISEMPNMSLSSMAYDFGYSATPLLVTSVASEGVGTLYSRIGLQFNSYGRAGGYGINVFWKSNRIMDIDIHRIRLGGGKTGKDYMLPHFDFYGQSGKVKHWPWHQLDKLYRGKY